ncbi:MAG TPA: hypothetical protein PKO06_00070 [Candidatus Ozemobacteraceae bacterium]|nr:hypothetical protein [Candidatus Ozemobacteraceae bacterium]
MSPVVRQVLMLLLLCGCVLTQNGYAETPVAEVKIERELFPQPYERLLDGYAYPEDRLLALFRCLCLARSDAHLSVAIISLERAIGELMRTQSALLRHQLLTAEDPKQRMQEWMVWWSTVARRAETAAFASLFRLMSTEEKARYGFAALEKESLEQENELYDPDYLAAYADVIPERHEFTRQIHKVYWCEDSVTDPLESLMTRLKFAFSTEEVLRYLARLCGRMSDSPLRQSLEKLQTRLTGNLVDDIIHENGVLLENNLYGSEIALIGVTAAGRVLIRESLIRGRLQLLVKHAQGIRSRLDREIFVPILEQIGRRLVELGANSSESVKLHLQHMRERLQEIVNATVTADAPADDQTDLVLFRKMGEYLVAEDRNSLMRGAPVLFARP